MSKMASDKTTRPDDVDVESFEARYHSGAIKTARNGIVLVPQPSDDPRDPLNWPMGRKVPVAAALCLATFAQFCGGLCGQLIHGPQAALYGVTTTQMAYQNSLANAGMAFGGFIWLPLSHKFGRSSAVFWSLLGLFLCQVWAGMMTDKDDYSKFLGARFMSGFFGVVTGVLGPRVLVDLFLLHQRGRAFTIFHYAFDFGTVAGPTLGAFVASAGTWRDAYWWTTALALFALIVCFIFLHETAWDREAGADHSYDPPSGFLANRFATFFPGTRVTLYASLLDTLKVGAKLFIVAVTPVTICLSMFTLVSFGFYVAMNSITPIWLQKPEKSGGYGFTSSQNALFSFSHWIGISLALLYGQLVSDRLPLYLCSKFGNGVWKPEYRLHALWIPALFCNPIGLDHFGATLQNHSSWGVLALATIMVTFGSLSITPITVNYACEIFTKNPAETAIVLNFFRVAFGLSVTFYIQP